MSLRTAIRDMLTGGDPTALSDVPADEVAQALTNYADTASLAEADALAPIVSRASHVPFDEDIDGELGAPLVDVHADLASLDPVESAADGDGDTLDPGDSIDDPPAGNEQASGDIGSDADTPDDHDDSDDAAADQADAADSTDVDPDDWFDVEPTAAAPAAAGIDAAIADDASTADDALAFGTGTTSGAHDVETPVDADEVDTSIDTRFESTPTFDDVAIEADAINELPTDDGVFDPGLIDDDVEVDEGPVDDSFGDVDFDL